MGKVKLDLHDLTYLRHGTPTQRAAAAAIDALGILDDLAEFTPALAGTIPLDVDLPGSDLDLICHAPDLAAFIGRVRELYDHLEAFRLTRERLRGVDSVVASFRHDGWGYELFAQPVPVAEQYACLHLLAEARLLATGGDEAREAIRALKRQGLKTEPAFARHFGLAGDPYEALARLGEAVKPA
jgi:hypothetical protein